MGELHTIGARVAPFAVAHRSVLPGGNLDAVRLDGLGVVNLEPAPPGSRYVREGELEPDEAVRCAPATASGVRSSLVAGAIVGVAALLTTASGGGEPALAWVVGLAAGGLASTLCLAIDARRLAADLGAEFELATARFVYWRAALEFLTAERSLNRINRDQARRHAADLEAELAGTRAARATLARELGEVREDLGKLEATLERLEADDEPQASYAARALSSWLARQAAAGREAAR